MKYILCICTMALVSCGTTRSLEQIQLDYELNKLWIEYEYKADSLIINYYENKLLDN
jgi:uncharacterized lipoprotein YehR (DUF1307 family)